MQGAHVRRGGAVGMLVVLAATAVAVGGVVVFARHDRSDSAILRVENLRYWAPEDLPIQYCVRDEPSGFVSNAEFESIVDDAFAAWGVPHQDVGACRDPLSADQYAKNGINEIGWRPWADPLGFTSSEMRCGTSCDPTGDHRLKEFDVMIASRPGAEFETEACLKSNVLHEVGHALGLGHVADASVMSNFSECRTELTGKDTAMIEARYGHDRSGRQPIRDDAATIEELVFLRVRLLGGIVRTGEVDLGAADLLADLLYEAHSPAFKRSLFEGGLRGSPTPGRCGNAR